MAFKQYFDNVPNFDYVSRLPNSKSISDYVQTKNLFKRVKINDEIFNDLTYFTKSKIKEDERPDNVAFRVYGDSNLDWVIMLSNNIINYESEWPMDQYSYNNYLLEKYGSYENLESIHHYETDEVRDSDGNVILEKGLEVPQNFSVSYFDQQTQTQRTSNNITYPVTNIQYEDRSQDKKSNIYVLKDIYIPIIIDDIEKLMPYKEGSTQFISAGVARGENIRLFG